DIPTDLGEAFTKELLDAAKQVPASQGAMADWPAMWATDTIVVARDAFAHVSFMPIPSVPPCNCKWAIVFEDHSGYLRTMDAIKRQQLAKGGARVAELLHAIRPYGGSRGRRHGPYRPSTIRIRYIMELFYIQLDQIFRRIFFRAASAAM